MRVPLLDLKRQYQSMKEEIDSAIARVVQSQYFILGEEVKKFEEEIADYCEAKYGIGVASGTDALLLSLRAIGVGEGENDKVITTPFTFFATAGAIVNAGGEPVFVDIDPETFNINPGELERLLSQDPQLQKQVKAIIPVHLYGQMADLDPIMEVAEKYNIIVIEDAAQAIGAEYKEKKAGSVGDLGCFSFFPSKNLGGYGDGGMVVTNRIELAHKVRSLRVHGSTQTYYHEMIGYNSRLDEMQAAVLSTKLPYLDGWSASRAANARYYTERLKDIDEIIPPKVSDNCKHIYHQYTIRVTSGRRDELKQYLKEEGIGTKIYYPLPLHLQECFKDLGYKEGDFPIAEEASKEVLSLPIFPELTKKELDFVIDCVSEFENEFS
ncbi:MAG: DegT/DnrJ/EryC1/StrS family aminotransferase [candidate division WOR-3 bacterium]|nr:DegT/DnrJ/EryC1/StrS family aminotransferase [candidate division WOR-3 bacterium]